MDAFMKKVRKKQSPLNDKSEAETDPSEMALEDDDTDPFLSSEFAGKLTFAGGDNEFAKEFDDTDKVKDMSSYPVPYQGSHRDTCRVAFEVTSAEVIKDTKTSSVLPGSSSHVDYTIMVSSSAGLKELTTCIVRRYSDFEHLHKVLKKRFSDLLATVVFPQKVFMGNFSSETIAKRSRAFEQYLTHLYHILDVRYSREFIRFFTGEDFPQAVLAFREGKHFNVVTFLECYVPVMEKLYGNSHSRIAQAVCMLVVSHTKTNRRDVADSYATLAMDSLPESSLTVPLLQAMTRLRWSLGRDKTDVEGRLGVLRIRGVDVDTPLDLETELCQRIQLESP